MEVGRSGELDTLQLGQRHCVYKSRSICRSKADSVRISKLCPAISAGGGGNPSPLLWIFAVRTEYSVDVLSDRLEPLLRCRIQNVNQVNFDGCIGFFLSK